jgi:hypothetical protein
LYVQAGRFHAAEDQPDGPPPLPPQMARKSDSAAALLWCTNNEGKLKLKNQNQNTEQRKAKSSFLNSSFLKS